MSEESGPRVEALLARRSSARGFRSEPIPRDEMRALLAAAQRAPSWCNIQPWRVTVTAPPVTGELANELERAATGGPAAPEIPFPEEYPEPYRAHRRACGHALYRAMGVARDDRDGRTRAWLRNYRFFDAPHVAVVCQDRRLGPYASVDVGVWLGVLLTVAEERGIGACPMASIAAYPAPLRAALDIPDHEVVLFGVALGYRDDEVAANACRTDREPLEANVRFMGFD